MSRLSDYIFLKIHPTCQELWPFENLGILNLSATYLKNYLNLKLGQLIGDDEKIT